MLCESVTTALTATVPETVASLPGLLMVTAGEAEDGGGGAGVVTTPAAKSWHGILTMKASKQIPSQGGSRGVLFWELEFRP